MELLFIGFPFSFLEFHIVILLLQEVILSLSETLITGSVIFSATEIIPLYKVFATAHWLPQFPQLGRKRQQILPHRSL